jgi:hypothetical protein
MNTIKNSFSKIKASDEFKDKLLRELHASQTKINNYNEKTFSKSNDLNLFVTPREHLVTGKIYYKQYIAAAATFVILAGIVSFKLIIPRLEKGISDSEVIAYAPQTEPATKNDHLNESYENPNYNENISSQSSKTDISSNNSEASVTSKETETNLTSKKVEGTTSSVKTETTINTKVESNIKPKTNENNSNSKMINDSPSSTSEIPVSKNDASKKTEALLPRNSMSNEKDSSDKAGPISDATAITSSAPLENRNVNETTSIDSIYVPKIETPKSSTFATAKMIPLIIYKGNIYIHSSIKTSSEEVKNLLGQKLGTTKNNIDEWSSKEAYSNEFASNIGTTDVYSVKGYDETFRIMTNSKGEDGTNFTDFYECLNGITLKKGEDILSKLKVQDNVITSKFQNYDDWNNGTGIFHPMDNSDLQKKLINEINLATPYLPEDVDASLEDYRNEYGFKQISFDLKDGVKNVTFTIFKNGYVYYDSAKVYLKIDSNFAEELWNSLNMMKPN